MGLKSMFGGNLERLVTETDSLMEWKQDPQVQDALREYLVNQKEGFRKPYSTHLLRIIMEHLHFQFLQVLGKFAWRYVEHLKTQR